MYRESLGVLAEDLLDWLNRNLTATVDLATREQIASFPIFPTSTEFQALTKLSLPNDFRDPIDVASLVADQVARDYRKLLTGLGARPLDILDYFRLHALPAAAAERISVVQATELLHFVAVHQDELGPLRDSLATSKIVPCTDGALYAPQEVHMPSREIAALATDLPVATTEGIAHAVLDWLGVQKAPSNKALAVAVARVGKGRRSGRLGCRGRASDAPGAR